jgi:hypothetical protein
VRFLADPRIERRKHFGGKMLEAGEITRILDEVARGNRDAFRVIVRAYSLPLRSYLASQIHTLDDVAQEVYHRGGAILEDG